jgi:hypothetical protein
MKGYVTYQGRRYRIIGSWIADDDPPAYRMFRLKPFRGAEVLAPESECSPWKRGTVRHLNGKQPHRDHRPVHLDIDTGSEIIKARLKGKRKSFACTFGGLYDMLARQTIINAKRDRAFAKRTRRR